MQPDINIDHKVQEDQVKELPKETVSLEDSKGLDPQEQNWKKFREERAAERKQLEEERKRSAEAKKRAEEKAAEAEALKAAMESILNKPSASYQEQEEESEEKRIDRLVESKLAERQRRAEEERRRKEQEELPSTLSRTYNDFNEVCSTENLDYLQYHYPEVARAYQHMPDGFDKWSDIYKAVKRFVPNPDSKRDQVRADKNFNKPQSGSINGASQPSMGSSAVHLDEQRKADNWARMQRTIKGV